MTLPADTRNAARRAISMLIVLAGVVPPACGCTAAPPAAGADTAADMAVHPCGAGNAAPARDHAHPSDDAHHCSDCGSAAVAGEAIVVSKVDKPEHDPLPAAAAPAPHACTANTRQCKAASPHGSPPLARTTPVTLNIILLI